MLQMGLDHEICSSDEGVYETMTQRDDAAIRSELERHWSVTGAEDPTLVHAIYDENVTVEHP
jgi:hypothetical protein